MEIRATKRAAEKAATPDCPEGKQTIIGEVISVKTHENAYGKRLVMTVKSTDGWMCWGSVPAAISAVSRGDRIQFNATLTRSDTDSKFGFFKRPSKASIIE